MELPPFLNDEQKSAQRMRDDGALPKPRSCLRAAFLSTHFDALAVRRFAKAGLVSLF
jgi:hypothetical protein